MSKNTIVRARINEDEKIQAEEILNNLGLDSSTAIRMFFKQVIIHRGLPFEVREDPFYSKSNLDELERRVAEMNAGAGELHELIEVDDALSE